jgi:hypothetical protein
MARQRSLVLVTSEVFQPPTFDRMDDAHQIETLTKSFPFRWKNGQRDSVESLATVLAYARDRELFRKCGCTSWEQFCQQYYDGDAAGFDELIDGVRILQREHWRGPIAEVDARSAAAKARQQAADKPQGKHHVDINMKRGGTGASYRLRRIARLKPDVLDRYERGEFPSVDAAYRHAFALNDLRSAWRHACADDRETFIREVTTHPIED